jgi:hypothetical protein
MPNETASAPFTIDGWDEQPVVEEHEIRIVRTQISKQFSGDLAGRSTGDMIMIHVAGEPAAYCGFEYVTGTLAGREGGFVLHHNAGAGISGGLSLTVVPGSGFGALAGLSGSAKVEIDGDPGNPAAPHRLILDYTLDSTAS